jgi:uncharacterized DUF497 family protein
MEFEWDPVKAVSNKKKHGISFRLAITVFDDPFALRTTDEKHSTTEEERFWQIGESDSGVLVVVFTVRGKGNKERYRLISARKANKSERALYEINRRIPI